MRIGLFIPCFIDAFFPEVGIATLELSESRVTASMIVFGHGGRYAQAAIPPLCVTIEVYHCVAIRSILDRGLRSSVFSHVKHAWPKMTGRNARSLFPVSVDHVSGNATCLKGGTHA
jgi:hypothetical protein